MASKKKNKRKSGKNGALAALALLVLVILVAVLVLYFVKPDAIEYVYNEITVIFGRDDRPTEENPTDGKGGGSGVVTGQLSEIASADLSIHFISMENDNAGDCTLIKCGDTEVLVDAGSTQSSAPVIKNYVDRYCTDGVLEYVVATHADTDHISGFIGTSTNKVYNGILYSYSIGTIIQFDKTNKTPSANTVYGKYQTAVEYAATNGASVYTASQCWYGRDGAQRQYSLNESGTVTMNILYNYYYENASSDENNYSVCMLLTQQTAEGAKNYLFTGDLEKEGEQYLVEYNQLPQVELFKAGHHGSPTSSNDCLLSVVRPKNVVVCCCAGTDEYTSNKDNQFPSQAFIGRVCRYTENVYCPNVVSDNGAGYEKMNGDIVFYCSGGELKLYCSNNDTVLKDTDWFKENRVWE